MNANSLLANAIAAGFDKLSPRDVMLCTLYGANNGGGSGSGSSVLEGNGSPVGVVTPIAIGQLYSDVSGTGLWQSTGLTNTSWTQLV